MPGAVPMVLDHRGNLVWMDDRFRQTMNLNMQRFDGRDYLTFWSGKKVEGYGQGFNYMLDSSYQVAYTVDAVGQDLHADLHEFRLTENGTALLTVYAMTEIDLSPWGGPKRGWVLDGMVQEVDIKTGALLFEWRALDHFSISDSFLDVGDRGKSPEAAFDWFHINSVDKDSAGNYYISSRHLHNVFCVNSSGDVVWQIGGKGNEFKDFSGGAATDFSWQHHARWSLDDRTLTLFDNGASYDEVTGAASRGMVISLDLEQKTATLVSCYVHPRGYLSPSQGSFQILPPPNSRKDQNGSFQSTDFSRPVSSHDHLFVGYGEMPGWTEFSADGQVLCDVTFGSMVFTKFGWVQSYRAMKAPWVGRPKTVPTLKVTHSIFESTAYVSWNGATEVDSWRLESCKSHSESDTEDGCRAIDQAAKDGFETSFVLPAELGNFLRVAALDRHNNVLALSNVVYSDTGLPVDGLDDIDDDAHSTFTDELVLWTGISLITYAVYRHRRRLHTHGRMLSGFLYSKIVGGERNTK